MRRLVTLCRMVAERPLLELLPPKSVRIGTYCRTTLAVSSRQPAIRRIDRTHRDRVVCTTFRPTCESSTQNRATCLSGVLVQKVGDNVSGDVMNVDRKIAAYPNFR